MVEVKIKKKPNCAIILELTVVKFILNKDTVEKKEKAGRKIVCIRRPYCAGRWWCCGVLWCVALNSAADRADPLEWG